MSLSQMSSFLTTKRSTPFLTTTLALGMGVLGAASVGQANDFTAEQIEFFEKQVRPILAESCYDCHGSHRHENGLRLDSREAVIRGSDYSKVIELGNPNASKLIKSIRHEPGVEAMPKKADKLSSQQIAVLEKWIAQGAPWPKGEVVADHKESWKEHWSFQVVTKPEVPKAGKLQADIQNPIDSFVAEKLEAAELNFAPKANSEELFRRVYLNLIGLLPSFEEVQKFKQNPSQEALNSTIDQLLASPAYGERWARQWLDVVRYSDTMGYQAGGTDIRYPHAYTYRDWVIEAFNKDMPYDQFIRMQLAADKVHGMPQEQDAGHKDLAALGMLTVGDRFLGDRLLQNDDRIDVITRGILGLSVSCARCHDHKYDPISAQDYYALYSVFNSSEQPPKLPVIGYASDTKARETFEKENATIEADILKFKSDIFQDFLDPAKVVNYLTYVRDSANFQGESFRAEAAKRKLRDRIAARYRDMIKASALKEKPHPIFTIWKAFSELPDKEFAQKAQATKEALLKDPSKTHPLLLEELKKNPTPQSFANVSQWYAEWLTKMANLSTPPTGAWKDLAETLKKLPNNSLVLTVNDMPNFFTTKDRLAHTQLNNKILKLELDSAGAPQRAMVMLDRATPADVRVMIRGNPGRQGAPAPRAFLSALGGQKFQDGSGRLELANAMVDPKNPFTARVFVNRVWFLHFGRPIVGNTSDFGVQTPAPEQLQLLNYLSSYFMENGWSVKKLHRLILASRTYQQSTLTTPEKDLKDPEYLLMSRFARQRIDYETLRDTTLQVSGDLDANKRGGRSVPYANPEADSRRSVYMFVDRYEQPTVPAMFDFANPDSHSPQRFNTTVPQQTLFLMNSPYMKKRSDHVLKVKPEITSTSTPEKSITSLYHKILLRDPKPEELRLATQFLQDAPNLEIHPFKWEYGSLQVQKTGTENQFTIGEFTRFAHQFVKDKNPTWAPAPKIPDPKFGYIFWSAQTSHPGNSEKAVAIRWQAPMDGEYSVKGNLKLHSDKGDGIRGFILGPHNHILVNQLVKPATTSEMLTTLHLKKGEILSFVVHCEINSNHDGFHWQPSIYLKNTQGSDELITSSQRDFCGPSGWPLNREKSQTGLSQLAQVLLMSNEFQFID